MKCIALFLLLIMATLSGISAQDIVLKPMKKVANFTSQFDAASKKMNSIDSDFLQEKHLSMMEENIKSKGRLQ